MIKRIFLVLLAFAIASPSFAQVGNPALVGNSIQAVIKEKGIQRGFAQNDPRFNVTSDAVSVAAGAVASSATAAVLVGTAPAWGSILLSTIATLAVGSVVAWGVSALSQWLFGADGKAVDPSHAAQAGGVQSVAPSPVATGAVVWANGPGGDSSRTFSSWVNAGGSVFASNPGAAATLYAEKTKAISGASSYSLGAAISVPSQGIQDSYWGNISGVSNGRPYVVIPITFLDASGHEVSRSLADFSQMTSDVACAAGWGAGSSCGSVYRPEYMGGPITAFPAAAGATYTAPGAAATPLAPGALMQAMPQQALAESANPQVIADLANQVWARAASQPGYTGIPFSMDNPITAPDVVRWSQANPGQMPTVGDLMAPSPSGSTLFPSPGATTQTPTPSTNTSGNVTNNITNVTNNNIDLGPDPGVEFGSPLAPTAESILDPILKLLPGFRDYQMERRVNAQCPRLTIDFFGKELTMSTHCELVEQLRPRIQAVSSLVWVIVALFIVLGA